MEHQEPLEAGAGVDKLPDPVEHQVNDLLANGVVASSIVVGSVFLSIDKLLRVEQLTISPAPCLINDSWLKINEDSSWDMFPSTWGKQLLN